jgi:hypothetical protein
MHPLPSDVFMPPQSAQYSDNFTATTCNIGFNAVLLSVRAIASSSVLQIKSLEYTTT